MLKNKFLVGALISLLCAATLTSCGSNTVTDTNGNGTQQGGTETKVTEGISDNVSEAISDIKDSMGDREETTHGSDGERANSEKTLPRHRDAVPYGK